jgi:GT2 family glycosyltransferase/ubiquinone/menaquinone biosynthesis C-methylase UbiE
VIENAINVDEFDIVNQATDKFRFGIISSNFPKKGLEDFVKLAELCREEVPEAEFVIIGPATRVAQTMRGVRGGNDHLPTNVDIVDYQPAALDAIRRVNVVVNFSRFQESFGRTVLEGMAARRPSLAYDWGALSEVVVHDVTGFLVPFGKPDAAVPYVKRLCTDRGLLERMGEAARSRARTQYSIDQLRSKIADVSRTLVSKPNPVTRRYSSLVDRRLSALADCSIDIVVCVHNALEETRLCLDSVIRNRQPHHRIILIDDGSGQETRRFLKGFARSHPMVQLTRQQTALGYTRSANAGLRQTTAEFIILLNSDTIVTPRWAEKMADAVFSTRGAGIVGPMSNAASYQSLPDVNATATQTPVNRLPLGMSAEDVNRLCEEWTHGYFMPVVPLVHGFCFGVTRKALDRIGLFDEELFPMGYGEENDYCLRALASGIWPVIATHTFVFHAKSKSYSEQRRSILSDKSQKRLYDRHGREQFLGYVDLLRSNPVLMSLRERASALWAEREKAPDIKLPSPSTLGDISDNEWLDLLQQSVERELIGNLRFPRFPSEQMQRGSVGTVGVHGVNEAFRFYEFVRRKMIELERPLVPDSTILDFGVGWGRMIRCFLRDVEADGLYGVDVSDRFLIAAKDCGVPGELRKIKPRDSMPYPDDHFDLVFAYSVFTHLPEDVQDLWLAEIKRVLKPGGVFVATVQPPRFLDFVKQITEKQKSDSNWYRELSEALTAKNDAEEILEREGFVFFPTNNGVTYGDTVMSPRYVGEHWSSFFRILEFLDDPSRFVQAVVTAVGADTSSHKAGHLQ